VEHKDEHNCMRVGYTKTVALCFTVKDAEGSMWSVKLICISWAVASAWEGNVYKFSPIFTRICRQMEQLDHKLCKCNANLEATSITRVTSVVLDDQCPWEEFRLGGNVIGRRMRLPATPYARPSFLCSGKHCLSLLPRIKG
jgi:hypothetical protein